MIKLVYVIRAREGMGAEFHRYWLEEHGPKVKSVAEAINAKRYVQSHTIETPLSGALTESRGGMTPAFEGITEVWWDSLDDLTAAAGTAEGQDALKMLLDDESTFIDFERSTIFFTEEHEIFDRVTA